MEEQIIEEEVQVETSPEPSGAENTDKDTQGPIPYDRFQKVVAERNAERERAKELESKLGSYQKAREEEEARVLAETGRYKELWEKAQEELQQERIAKEKIRLDSLKKDAATKAGVPQLWERLRGETEEELLADANNLVKSFPYPQAPKIDGAAGTSASNGKNGRFRTEAERREIATRYRIRDWRTVPEEY